MAKIIRHEWTSKGPVGKRVRHVAFGYTLAIHGQRERKVSSAWTCEEDALKALSARQQQIRGGQTDRSVDVTFGHARSGISNSKVIMASDHCTRTSAFLRNSCSRLSGPGC